MRAAWLFEYLGKLNYSFFEPTWLAELVKAPSLLYDYLCRFDYIQGVMLVVDAHNQQPFEPREWGNSWGISA